MRPSLHIGAIVALVVIAICFTCCATGYQIALPNTQLQNDAQNLDTLVRERRQLESFDDGDDGDFSAPQQQAPEDPGFWDRVVQVAIKLFSKFVEWLNS